jgi:hypothetical protein
MIAGIILTVVKCMTCEWYINYFVKPVKVHFIIRVRTSVTATLRKMYHPWQEL